MKVSRGRAGNHNCQPPQLGSGWLPGRQRPGLVRGQDTSAVGEGGAQEVVWATGLGENARAAMGELCPSKPGAGAGRAGRRDPECPHRAPRCVPCWASCRLCPQQDTEMPRATPPHRVHQGPALSCRCPSAHGGGSTGGILQVLLRLRMGLKRGTCPRDTSSSPGCPSLWSPGAVGAHEKGSSVRPGAVQAPAGRDPCELFLSPEQSGLDYMA